MKLYRYEQRERCQHTEFIINRGREGFATPAGVEIKFYQRELF